MVLREPVNRNFNLTPTVYHKSQFSCGCTQSANINNTELLNYQTMLEISKRMCIRLMYSTINYSLVCIIEGIKSFMT